MKIKAGSLVVPKHPSNTCSRLERYLVLNVYSYGSSKTDREDDRIQAALCLYKNERDGFEVRTILLPELKYIATTNGGIECLDGISNLFNKDSLWKTPIDEFKRGDCLRYEPTEQDAYSELTGLPLFVIGVDSENARLKCLYYYDGRYQIGLFYSSDVRFANNMEKMSDIMEWLETGIAV